MAPSASYSGQNNIAVLPRPSFSPPPPPPLQHQQQHQQAYPALSFARRSSAGRLASSTLAVRPSVPTSKSALSVVNSAQLGNATSTVTPSLPAPDSHRRASRPYLRALDTGSMTSFSSITPLAPLAKAAGHKRGSSTSSLPGVPSPFSSQTQFATPYATYEEPDQDVSSCTAATPKIKPYLRKMSASTAKEDQGYVDLSKSVSENERLSGLGIQDFAVRPLTDTPMVHSPRGHDRTTSGGSQISTGSSSFKSNQPFTHPMKQTPRPYTPQTGLSYAPSPADEHADETDDVIEDFQPSNGFRSRRSMSISSMATTSYPTPLAQSYTPNDFDPVVPKVFGASQSNLSIISSHSGTNGRPRRDTNRSSTDFAPASSLRSSFDQTFSFGPRRVETEPLSREERIRAARQKFDAKEATKDRKAQRDATRRREAHEAKLAKRSARSPRPKSGSPLKKPIALPPPAARGDDSPDGGSKRNTGRKGSSAASQNAEAKLQSRSYDQTRPSHPAALPHHVLSVGLSEKNPRVQHTTRPPRRASDSSWLRFSTWLQTRMLSCGGRRD